MKLEARRIVEQLLSPRQPCLGAVFCTYTFDPAYFEEHVLRTLLALGGDPDEDGARYHDEARAALRDTPVACFVDANVRRGGRRLPYDLHLVRARTFHPKVMVTLFETEARVAIGSGNLTRPGLEDNAELFFTRVLRYDDPVDVAMLRSIDGFFAACAELAGGGGTQLAAVRQALDVRIAGTRAPAASAPIDALFVHTFETAGLRALAEVLPAGAKLVRIGVLAPFFERDDLPIADEHEGLSSVLAALLALVPAAAGTPPALELGVPWEDAPLAPPQATALPALVAGPGLWALRQGADDGDAEDDAARVDYLRIDKITAKQVTVRDAGDRAQRLERELFEEALADRRLWQVDPPTVYAPARILQRLGAEHPLQLWLHPTASLTPSGRPVSRPLHAKLFLITVNHRGATSTYALVGSANASRAAMARRVAEGSNVEAGVLVRFDGEVRLRDVLPSLVASDVAGVQLRARAAPVLDVDLSAWIGDVVHDAEARTLTIPWASAGPAGLTAWSLRYLDRELCGGDGPAAEATLVRDFDLAAASAELELSAGGRSWMIPIRVADLAQLPTRPGARAAELRELLALLGRRVGAERLATLQARGPAGVAAVLESLFGEGFGPTDVFKAWWGLRQDLEAAPSVTSLRHRLFGPTGARAVWTKLCEVPEHELSREEVWLYGSELVRELAAANLVEGPDQRARAELLATLVAELRADLAEREPSGAGLAWFHDVRTFYRAAGRGP